MLSQSKCRGVKLLEFPEIADPRGNLVFAEFPDHLPFQPMRFFATYAVPDGSVRGEHAHKRNEQVIVCLRGSLTVAVDDGEARESYILDSPSLGIYIPPGVWATQTYQSDDCLMLVLASEVYDESGYIRNYSDFVNYVKSGDAS